MGCAGEGLEDGAVEAGAVEEGAVEAAGLSGWLGAGWEAVVLEPLRAPGVVLRLVARGMVRSRSCRMSAPRSTKLSACITCGNRVAKFNTEHSSIPMKSPDYGAFHHTEHSIARGSNNRKLPSMCGSASCKRIPPSTEHSIIQSIPSYSIPSYRALHCTERSIIKSIPSHGGSNNRKLPSSYMCGSASCERIPPNLMQSNSLYRAFHRTGAVSTIVSWRAAACVAVPARQERLKETARSSAKHISKQHRPRAGTQHKQRAKVRAHGYRHCPHGSAQSSKQHRVSASIPDSSIQAQAS